VNGKWYSLITVIRFSEWTPEVCERNLTERIQLQDPLAPGPLKLAWKVAPFTAWLGILDELRAGNVCLSDDFEATLPGEVDDARMLSYIPAPGGFIHNDTPLPMF
jgi:hypothetical protein